MDKLQEKLNYQFKNKNLLIEALSHSSYANEKGTKSYERLEFLGDSLLSIIVSEHLYQNFPNLPEGNLTRIRAAVVCEQTLEKCALSLDLGKFIFLSHGEELTGGRCRTSILADVVEAIIAAMYLDSNLDTVRKWVLDMLSSSICDAACGRLFQDYKTALQEHLQSINHDKITYSLISEEGPDHNKSFSFQVLWGGNVLGEGCGRTKKEAEQAAAKEALKRTAFKK